MGRGRTPLSRKRSPPYGAGVRRTWVVLVALALVAGCADGGERATPAPTTGAPMATIAPTTTTTPPTTTTAPPPTERVTLAFTGDLLPHLGVLAQAQAYGAPGGAAYDFRPIFRDVEPILARADLALCHLEVPLSADNALIASYPSFSSPREVGRAIAHAGYDGCSTASNHSLDQGPGGVTSTLAVLDRFALGHAGTARTAAEATTPTLYETPGGVTVGHVSGAYGYNGYVPDTPWRVGTLDPTALIRAAERTRRAGADLVVASLHWGVEYQHDPTAEHLALAERLAASGAVDLIVGHHAHVVQPVRRFHGVPVVFGVGNFLSGMVETDTRDGVIVGVRAARPAGTDDWRFAVSLTPTWVDHSSFTIRPVVETLAAGGAGVADDLRASWARTVSVMAANGVARPARPLP